MATADEQDPPANIEQANDKLDQLVARYVDRLNAGERLDPEEILGDQPAIGPEVLRRLEAFLDLAAEVNTAPRLSTLGDYRLVRQIGRGGMGVVYEAWQNSMDRRVALKVLPAGAAADDSAFQRFMREAKTAGKLNHRSVVAIYGMGVEGDTPYFAMEYIEGETLAQVLGRLKAAEGSDEDEKTETILQGLSRLFTQTARKAATGAATEAVDTGAPAAERREVFGADEGNIIYFGRLAEICASVAEGLQHAHSKGIVHRDIKPSNLILDCEGRLRILDFGLAHLEGQESLTASGGVVGTPLYMSPEQARARRVPIDHRTDIYSLGATMYEMVTLKPPFRGRNYQETLGHILNRDPLEPRKVNPRVPLDLQTILLKCLRKEPDDRYGTAEALAQDLRRFVRGDPIEARPQSPLERLLRRASRHRGKLLVAAGAFILILVCGLLAYMLAVEREKTSTRRYERTVIGAAMKLLRGESILSAREEGSSTPFLPTQYRAILSESGRRVVEEATEELARIAAILPERFEGHYYRARGLRLLERREEAVAELEEALRRKPDFVPAMVLMTELLGKDEKHGEIKIRRESSDSADWGEAWAEARQALKKKRWEAAARAYKKLISCEEASGRELYLGSAIENLLGRGIARLASENFDGAEEDFQAARTKSLILWGEFLEPVLLLGQAYYLKGERSRAEDKFTEVLERSPDKDKAALWIAAVYTSLLNSCARQRRFEEAIEAGKKAIQFNREDTRTRKDLGWALLRHLWVKGEWGGTREGEATPAEFVELIDLAGKTLELDRRDPASYTLLSKVLEAQGDLDRAREFSEKAMELERKKLQGTSKERSDMNTKRTLKEATTAAALFLGGVGVAQEGAFTGVRQLPPPASSPFTDWGPSATEDGLVLVFGSNRPDDNEGDFDLYIATRNAPDGDFDNVRNLSELNTDLHENNPNISPDGLTLYFTRGALVGKLPIHCDLYVATRSARGEPFVEEGPLDSPVNTEDGFEPDGSVTGDGLRLVFCRALETGGRVGPFDLYEAIRDDVEEPFGDVTRLAELEGPFGGIEVDEINPSISCNGLTIFFGDWHDNPPLGSRDIWVATRESLKDRFGNVRRLPAPVNTDFADEYTPFIACDWPAHGAKLYFVRCSGTGDQRTCNLFEATWTVPSFRRGDANGDGKVDISDPNFNLNYLFNAGPEPECMDSGDANDDGELDISDAIAALGSLFLGNFDIPAPGPASCGIDPTSDELTCETYSAVCQ